MKEPLRILFICQEIFPYLAEETPIRQLNRLLPEVCQANGFETRTFMPKFGEINERRNQLHEVIRLSGMNIIIDDTDHQYKMPAFRFTLSTTMTISVAAVVWLTKRGRSITTTTSAASSSPAV